MTFISLLLAPSDKLDNPDSDCQFPKQVKKVPLWRLTKRALQLVFGAFLLLSSLALVQG
jgi:hypothetical protein